MAALIRLLKLSALRRPPAGIRQQNEPNALDGDRAARDQPLLLQAQRLVRDRRLRERHRRDKIAYSDFISLAQQQQDP